MRSMHAILVSSCVRYVQEVIFNTWAWGAGKPSSGSGYGVQGIIMNRYLGHSSLPSDLA